MESLNSFKKILSKRRAVYLDTNIFIYHLENVEPYSSLTEVLFELLEHKTLRAHTSVLTLLEINVQFYKIDRPDQAAKCISFLSNLPFLTLHPLSLEIADEAAFLRAKYHLKTPDAIHVASVLKSGSDLMIANDKDFKKVKEIHYSQLDKFI